MRLKKLLNYCICILLAVVFLASCSPAASGDKPNAPAKYKAAVLIWSHGFEFMVALDTGIQKKAKELGIDITILDGQANSQVQIAQIEDNISKGVDAIILAPNNSDELVAGVKLANKAGIPVITVDGNVSPGSEVAAAVAFDNEAGGASAANVIKSKLTQGNEVLECTGAPGYYHALKRGHGFNEMMKTTTLKVITKDCQWDAEYAQRTVVDIVSANANIGGIMTHNDEMIRGVVSGLKQIGRQIPVGEPGHIVVVGIDGTPISLDLIRKKEIDATIQQDPFEMGALAVEAVYKVLKGEKVEKQYYIKPKVIDITNVDDPQNWGNIIKNK